MVAQHPAISEKASPAATSRREVLALGAAAGTALAAGLHVPKVHAAEDNTIRLALIGCGGRGGGAVRDAMAVPNAPIKLHAMADIFDNRLTSSYQGLSRMFGPRVDVPEERRFLGYDAYQQAIDTLRPGDIAMLTAYAYSRPQQLEYAVHKGVHVFMEKPFGVDPVSVRRIRAAGEAAQEKNLKIACGLMCRHSPARQALIEKVRDGQLGDLQLIRSYRLAGRMKLARRPADRNELEWQMRNHGNFYWISSGRFIEWLIHQVDECCWLKDSYPVTAQALAGQVANHDSCSQNLDNYAIEYTFSDGTKAMVNYRGVGDSHLEFATYVHGTKKAAQFSGSVHKGTVHTFRDQRIGDAFVEWTPPAEQRSPWQEEWRDLIEAIQKDLPYNEAERAANADVASIMGRAAAHTGQIITWDQVAGSSYEFFPAVDALTTASAAPIHDDPETGNYPVPVPGKWTEV